MKNLIIPDQYIPALSVRDMQRAVKLVKDTFEHQFSSILGLERISAPLFVLPQTGLNDDLNGVERPVQFDIKDIRQEVQIVQSLAKWKRMALLRYGFGMHEGLYTDMNAIRRDEELDNLHSVYVDQWDWERVIAREDRTLDYLKATVRDILKAVIQTLEVVRNRFPAITLSICPDVFFITSQELLDLYPGLDAKAREDAICKKHGTVFIMQIGGCLSDGSIHDGRAPDYDDWALNGDLLLWNEVLGRAFELTSMGIRVDAQSLRRQLDERGCPERAQLVYHRMLLEEKLPLTIGGGLGQSRLCMLLLQAAHIGQVHASVWSEEMIEACSKKGIHLL